MKKTAYWILIVIFVPMIFWYCMTGIKPAGKHAVIYQKNDLLESAWPDYRGNEMSNGRFLGGLSDPASLYVRASQWRVRRALARLFSFTDDGVIRNIKVVKNPGLFKQTRDAVVWLGHAGLFIRLDGKNLLIDPCMTHPPFTDRIIDTPCGFGDFRNIDYLLISHDHPDHLDFGTLTNIDLTGCTALVPLGVGALLKSKIKAIDVQEAGWYQKYDTGGADIKIYLVPAKHWSMRSLFDVNKTLWGGFIIKGKNKSIFFPGDTAYAPHFMELRRIFGKFDICLMPVGAYKPIEIMSQQHLSPVEAVKAFNDLQGRLFIPIHYGTFDISDEPYNEPIEMLEEIFSSRMPERAELKVLNIGEAFLLLSGSEVP